MFRIMENPPLRLVFLCVEHMVTVAWLTLFVRMAFPFIRRFSWGREWAWRVHQERVSRVIDMVGLMAHLDPDIRRASWYL